MTQQMSGENKHLISLISLTLASITLGTCLIFLIYVPHYELNIHRISIMSGIAFIIMLVLSVQGAFSFLKRKN